MESKKNGFTLIELLAVIAVLALVLVVGGVIVVGSLSENKDDLTAIQEKNIEATAQAYFNDNLDTYTQSTAPSECTDSGTNRTCTISSGVLVDGGYLEQPVDIKTKENVTYKIMFSFNLENGIVKNLKTQLTSGAPIIASQDTITASNLRPISYSNITTGSYSKEIKVENNKDYHQKIKIDLTNISIPDELKNVDFRWALFNKNTGNAVARGVFNEIGNNTTLNLLRDVIIEEGESSRQYILRIWIHDNGDPNSQASMLNKTFSANVVATTEYIEYTPESCFTFDSSTGTITEYDFEKCGYNIVIPRIIEGVEVTNLNYLRNRTSIETFIIFPNTLKNIFGHSNVSHITIPEGVTYMDFNTFSSLESIIMPDTLKTIKTFMMHEEQIKTLVLPPKMEMEDFMFEMAGLENVILTDGIKTVTGLNYNNIKSIEIPSSVTTINASAFSRNPNLTKIVIRGKTKLEEFTGGYEGLTPEGGLPSGANIEFRP